MAETPAGDHRGTTLDSIIERAEQGESWTFTRHGKPVAVLIGYDELERLRAAEASFNRIVATARALDERAGG